MDIEELKGRTDRMQRQLEGLEKRVMESERSHSIADIVVANIDKRLSGIEDSQKWITRLIIGAILLALLGFSLQGGFAPT